MRLALFALPLVVLSACQTPREACISQSQGDLRVINRLIAQTEANLARGFGLEERQEVVIRRDRCEITNPDGTVSTFRCDRQEVVTTEVPVALDLNAERATLASLRDQQAVLATRAQAAVQQCVAAYPDE